MWRADGVLYAESEFLHAPLTRKCCARRGAGRVHWMHPLHLPPIPPQKSTVCSSSSCSPRDGQRAAAADEQLILEGVDAPAAAGGDGIVAIDLAAAARRGRPRCEPHCRQAASASSATTFSACGSKSCRDATELSGVQVPSNTPSSARSGGDSGLGGRNSDV